MDNFKITPENLEEKSLTNREVLLILKKAAMNCDMYGYSRVLDVVEALTGDRNMENIEGEINLKLF